MELVELEDPAVLMIRIVSIRVSLTDQTTIIIVNKWSGFDEVTDILHS